MLGLTVHPKTVRRGPIEVRRARGRVPKPFVSPESGEAPAHLITSA